jgi:hypothetical protein
VQIADRATGEAPELQMNHEARIGDGDDLALRGDQLVTLNEVADVVFVLVRGFGVAVRWHGFDSFPRGEEHQNNVVEAFGDLSDDDQVRLLDISHKSTDAFRERLAKLGAPKAELRHGYRGHHDPQQPPRARRTHTKKLMPNGDIWLP